MSSWNPDDLTLKDKIVSKDGSTGGMLVGNRHHEANNGISAINTSTGQPIRMEGGEVVITRNAVSDNKKREFNGEMLTNRQILSKINESGGGVAFAEDGMELPSAIKLSNTSYDFGGVLMTDIDFVKEIYQSGGRLNLNLFPVDLISDLESESTSLIVSKILDDLNIENQIKVGEISKVESGKVVDSFFPHFWVETIQDGKKTIIDLKSRLWMDDDAPEGIFIDRPEEKYKYEGITKMIPIRMKNYIYNLQLDN